MNWTVFLCAIWTLYIAALHTFGGERRVVSPMRSAGVEPFARGTLLVAWHMVTWALLTLSVALFAAALDSALRSLVFFGAVQAAGYALVFLTVARRELSSSIRLPQWILLGPLTVSLLATAFPNPGAVAAGLLLGGIALLHLAWALGARWPARNGTELVQHVVGGSPKTRFPTRFATLMVVVAVAAMATVMLAPGVVPARRPLAWIVVAVFAARGLFGFIERRVRPAIALSPYAVFSRFMYSPLCLFIAALAGSSLW